MQNLKQKFNSLIHRHPWALQAGLALSLVVLAVISTSGLVKTTQARSLDTWIEVTAPQANDTWAVGSSQTIRFKLSKYATAGTTVSFKLCKNNPGICFVQDIATPQTISGAVGQEFTATWAKVGYAVDGVTKIVNDDSFVNNAVINLVLSSSDHPNDSPTSDVFSIMQVGVGVLPMSIHSNDGFGGKSFYLNDNTGQTGYIIGTIPINNSATPTIVIGDNNQPQYSLGTISFANSELLSNGQRKWNFTFAPSLFGIGAQPSFIDIIGQYSNFGLAYDLTGNTVFWSSTGTDTSVEDNVNIWPGLTAIVVDGSTNGNKIYNNYAQPQTGYVVGRGLSKLGITTAKPLHIYADLYRGNTYPPSFASIASVTTRRTSVYYPTSTDGYEAWEFTIPAHTTIDYGSDSSLYKKYDHFSGLFNYASGTAGLAVINSYTVNPNSPTDDIEIVNSNAVTLLPHIDSISPASGPVGTEFTLTGTNFGTETWEVMFYQAPGGGGADVISWTDTQIVAVIPNWASVGEHSIQVGLNIGSGSNGPIYSNEVSFTVTATPAHPASATYYSQSLTSGLIVNGVGPISFDTFQANFSQVATGSDVQFALGFFKADGTPVYLPADYGNAVDAEGYYTIPSESEATTFTLPTFLSSKASQVASVRFRIYMASADITATAQPWVQSTTLMFTASEGNTIGVINFVDAPEAGKVTKTIARGATGTFQIRVTPTNFTGSAILNVGPITKVGDSTNTPVTTITPQFATNPINLPNDFVDVNLQFTVANDASLGGVYQFDIFGHDTANENAILTPAVGIGQINIPTTDGPFSLTITPTSNTVVRGGTTPATYTVTVTRSAGFVGRVDLTSNIATAFTGVTGTFNPAFISFPTDTNFPTLTSELSVSATSSAGVVTDQAFIVNGTRGSDISTTTANLTVADSADVITLNLTLPVEGGKPTDATKLHPRFSFRLYNGLAKTMEKVGLVTNAQNQVAVTATHTELPAGTYTAYARSDRHLWSKSTQTNLVISDTTTTASLTFPTLKAGNLTSDNKINALDLPPASEYRIDNLWSLGDLNNDGKINILDLGYIMNFNYSLWGDQLPDETR